MSGLRSIYALDGSPTVIQSVIVGGGQGSGMVVADRSNDRARISKPGDHGAKAARRRATLAALALRLSCSVFAFGPETLNVVIPAPARSSFMTSSASLITSSINWQPR